MLGLERLSQQETGEAYSCSGWRYDGRRDPRVLGLMLVSSMERRRKIVEGIGGWVGLEALVGQFVLWVDRCVARSGSYCFLS